VAGKRAYPKHVLYAATKFAVRALTQGFAQELADDGIRVNAICPGVVDTPLWETIAAEQTRRGVKQNRSDLVRDYGAGVLLGRASTPEDITGLALFLASEDSDYMTGQCVNIDGGIIFD
jgi:meso-butanediol dehydrogenase / (S,S)-butanediol dehydrogenase / diacetyl reductase